MPNLTLKNYFTEDNNYLSNSKISDYLKSPYYFYRKDILHEIEKEQTNAMALGSAIDYLLAQDDNKPKYVVVDRRNLKNPPNDYIEVNQTQYDEIIEVANAVAMTDLFKDIDKKFLKQQVLTIDKKIGDHFSGLCGIPDYLLIDGEIAIIIDLKTSQTTDIEKYYWHCLQFGYFRQQAHYQKLVRHNFPQVKMIVSYHLVVDKQKDIYNVELFEIDQLEIDKAHLELERIVEEISNRKDYQPKNLTWESVRKLSRPGKYEE